MHNEDTIAAIATAPGEGGIGIVRISGELAKPVLRSVFVPKFSSEKENEWMEPRKLTYGHVIDSHRQVVDEVLAVYMKAPHTYTTEDVVEIHCHGSMISLRKTLSLVLDQGVRLAEPGEFTKRAFLHGRIDLSQAESVIDVIRAKSEKGNEAAMGQLSGRLSQEIRQIREKLVDVLVDLTVNIDYPDEDIEMLTYETLSRQMEIIRDEIQKLVATGHTGRILREGLRTVIVGKPNVGKSSLMNRLLRETRSIVTEVPGTTRDTIEESLNIRGIPLNITDTAGIRHTEDAVEKIGVEKSWAHLQRGDLILFMLDASRPWSEEDEEILRQLKGREEVLVILNKSDCPMQLRAEAFEAWFPRHHIVEASMADGSGLTELEDRIEEMVVGGDTKIQENVWVTNVRHEHLLRKAQQSAEDALTAIHQGEPLELVEIDVSDAWSTLGEITGETVQEDILTEVFSRFCLGK